MRKRFFFSLVTAALLCGVTAQRTECEHATVADIVFLVDGSGSIKSYNFEQIRQFLQSVILGLDIGSDKVRIGVAQYSNNPQKEFLLNEHTDKSSLIAAVGQIMHLKGKTYTGKAIDFLRTNFFTPGAGSRAAQRVPQIAVVITDGASSDNVMTPALNLRKHGVIVFAIGVGNTNLTGLKTIANHPPRRFLFNIGDFQALHLLTDGLLRTVCTSMGVQTEALADRYADVFFLVDSGVNQRQFKLFQSELLKLLKLLNVGESAYRVGLAQYGSEVKELFLLNAFQTKQETLDAIRGFRLRPQPNQPTKLGSALRYANNHFFIHEAGGRAHQGSRQFLVVVSGRRSDDHVAIPSRSIQSAGVTVVGMDAGATMETIERFASVGFAFNSTKVSNLATVIMDDKLGNVTEDCKEANMADIVFIVDESQSITKPNFQLVRTFLQRIVSGLDVGPNRVRVGMVLYNYTAEAEFYLDTFTDKTEVLQCIGLLPYREGGTYTGLAIRYAHKELFTSKRGSRKNVQKVAVVITDGQSADNVSDAALSLRRAGVTIYSIGIGEAKKEELEEIASSPTKNHVFMVTNFTELNPLRGTLQKAVCTDIIKKIDTEKTDKDAKTACKQKEEADIFILMDDSGSIENQDFLDMKEFILAFLRGFNIGPQLVRIGLVKYESKPELEFDLTDYTNADSVEEAVKKMEHLGGGTKTGSALSYMGPCFKRAEKSRGQKVPEYLIVISDGESQDEVKRPAEALRDQGVVIYSIGVKKSNQTQMKEISGDPKKTFYVNNFDALKTIRDKVFASICTPDVCEGDVFFLIDGSETISAHDFNKTKHFMKSIIGRVSVAQDRVRVGLMQFSTNYQLEFELNSFYNQMDVSQAIDNMKQLNEGTKTGQALSGVSQYFDETKGGRPHLNQMLILITDGRSHDKVKGPAEALRAKRVVIYTIGVGMVNLAQLVEISGTNEHVYVERSFDGLRDLEEKITSKVCRPQDCKTDKADVIFLVDESSSIHHHEFQSMLMFMESVVNQTTVGTDQTRFGVILYADEPRLDFTLQEYKSKQEVRRKVRSLQSLGVNTYTSKAMNFSIQYFNAANGGRKALKVPQVLMVITDGEASDPEFLQDSSDKLQQHGIQVISIGVKRAKPDELVIMTGGDTDKVFYVDNFKELETLFKKKVDSIFCKTTKEVCERADLVFLLDMSSSIGSENYKNMKNFTAEIVNSFQVSQDFWHVGLAQFSDTPKHEFYLDDYTNDKDLLAQISQLESTGINTYLGNALVFIRDYFTETHGGRRGVPKNLVLISDGNSHDDVEVAGEALRIKGIEVFAIAIGEVYDLQLLQITGNPERVIRAANYESLPLVKQKVVNVLCDRPLPSHECSVDVAIGFDLSRSNRVSGDTLTRGQTKLQMFLPDIVHYISSLDSLCCRPFSPVKPNIAFQVLAQGGQVLFSTDFESYDGDLVTKIMNFELAEPTFFNTALLDSFKEKFKTQSKARAKVLVIFSDGLDEDLMKLKRESELLRESGVHALLVVALEGVRDPAQLQMMEFGRGFGYEPPLTIGMQSVASNILKQIDSVSHKVCCNVLCKCVGAEGVRGPAGKPGPKGAVGLKGHPGFPGDEGLPGTRGLPGPEGPGGIRGCPGPRGQKGFRGSTGNRGEGGEEGVGGVNGEEGATGHDGAKGDPGRPGDPGSPGINGEKGVKGQRGLRGDPGNPGTANTIRGSRGERGDGGRRGSQGPDGEPGLDGAKGNPGPNGRQGLPGLKGSPGEAGIRGSLGIPGPSGPQGPRGERGSLGPNGPRGNPGPVGEPGRDGNSGGVGRVGTRGQKGQPGDPGPRGARGSQGARGEPGQDGRDGAGPPGPKGAKGDPGFPGYPGLEGDDGVKGAKGYPGPKGNLGQDGTSGRSGEVGDPGGIGDPGHEGRRGPAGQSINECQLITSIRNNCGCCSGQSKCPAYPTELVFALDMSQDVTPAIFGRQRSALLSLLEDVDVSESNCPSGARVAVVGYSTYTKYLIRFHDYHRKKQLMEAVKNLALERTSNQRHLGAAMRFVGNNVFKRVRAGILMRKVAVFFSGGPSQDIGDIVTAMMEYRGFNIVPAVVSLRNAPAISKAMEVDDTGSSIFTVLGRDMNADLRTVKSCAICYDPCRRALECAFIQDPVRPQEVDVDLVLVADGSREMQADEYAGVQQLMGSVVEQLHVSSLPGRTGNQARVAAVQISGTRDLKAEFGLQTYQNHNDMSRHLIQMQRKSGSSALGRTLEFALKEVLLKASQPRRKRALLAVLGTATALEDRLMLDYISKKAKCEGVALFVVTVGHRYERSQVEQLAGEPGPQHLIHVERLRSGEQAYARSFFRVFLSALNKGINTYPPADMKRTCDSLTEPDRGQGQTGLVYEEKRTVEVEEQEEEEEYEEEYEDYESQRETPTEITHLDNDNDKRGAKHRDVCLLPQDTGTCADYVLNWFFNTKTGRCTQFWFGGCAGNDNRFNTREECEELCV